MWEFVAVVVESADVVVGFVWVGCDDHDLSVKVVEVVN